MSQLPGGSKNKSPTNSLYAVTPIPSSVTVARMLTVFERGNRRVRGRFHKRNEVAKLQHRSSLVCPVIGKSSSNKLHLRYHWLLISVP